MFRTRSVDPGELVLEVADLALRPRRERPGRREPDGISLSVRRGEIVGIGGLLGSGRTELLETLFGAGSPGTLHGSVRFRGQPVRPRRPRQALRLGMAFVPEDRRVAGLAIDHSVLANTVLSIVDRIARAGIVPRAKETGAVRRMVEQLKVKLGSVNDPVGTLSGGNQQKVVFGRMLLTEPALLLLDEPTRGVDVGAKAEIYQLLGEAAQQGIGVLLASSELAELVGVCDRVVVLSGGRSVRELDTRHAGEADLLAASMGEGSTAQAVDVAGGIG
jgi:ribose transport system ATP-binding protein